MRYFKDSSLKYYWLSSVLHLLNSVDLLNSKSCAIKFSLLPFKTQISIVPEVFLLGTQNDHLQNRGKLLLICFNLLVNRFIVKTLLFMMS